MPETIGGLPLHPLIVHATVVLLPLSALGLLILIAVPRWRRTYGWLVLIGLLLSFVAAVVSKESGENLAARIGISQTHADWGDRLAPIAGILLLAAAVWYWRVRRGVTGALTVISAIVAALLAIGAIAVTVVVGHSGAEAAWSDRLEPPARSAPEAPAPAASPAAITLADVATHATADDCWSVVNGVVYDLTAWVAKHPGGAAAIESMCGQDATSAFSSQHGGQQAPEEALARFEIGRLQ